MLPKLPLFLELKFSSGGDYGRERYEPSELFLLMTLPSIPYSLRIIGIYLLLGLLLMCRWPLGEVYLPASSLDQYYPYRAYVQADSSSKYLVENPHLFDVVTIYQPQDIYYAKWLGKGILPLWDDLAFSGHPLQAGNQSALLYPPKLILCALLSPEVAHNSFLYFHVVMAGLGMFIFLRAQGLQELSAHLGGVCWMLNGATMVRFECKPFLPFSALLPWGLYLLYRHVREPGRGFVGPIALLYGVAIMAGNGQFAVYLGLFSACYYLFLSYFSERRGKLLLEGICALLLAVFLAAVVILPTLELHSYSNRPVISLETQRGQNRFLPENFLPLLVPEILGTPREHFYFSSQSSPIQNPLELTAHVSFGGFLLMFFSLPAARRRPQILFFGIAGLMTLLIAAGTPLHDLFFYLVPGAKFFTNTRIVWLFAFCMSCLAAFGLEECRERVPRGPLAAASFLWLTTVVAVCSIVARVQDRDPSVIRFLEEFQKKGGFDTYFSNFGPYGEFLGAVTESVFAHYSWSNGSFLFPLVGGLLTLLLLTKRRLQALIPMLIALELLIFAWAWNPSAPFDTTYPQVEGFSQLADSQRVVGLISGAQPSILTAYDIPIAGGYDSLLIDSYFLYCQIWNGNPTPFALMCVLTQQSQMFHRLARICAVDKYYTAPATVLSTGEKPIYSGDIHIYELEGSLSRARVCYRWVGAANKREAFSHLLSAEFEPADVAVRLGVSGGVERPGTEARILEDTPNRKVISANLSEPGLLILSDAYYPGWSAKVGDQTYPVELVNATFQGVMLPAGEHIVEFRFRPFSFWLGLALSSLTLLPALFLTFNSRRRRRGKSPSPSSAQEVS